MIRRGLVLAGGRGTRLGASTQVVNKHLLPVYDRPMVGFALEALAHCEVAEVAVLSTPRDLPLFRELLGEQSPSGLRLEYLEQPAPRGLADAVACAANFLAGRPAAVALADNLFLGAGWPALLQSAAADPERATILAIPVPDGRAFGVVQLDPSGTPLALVEKPELGGPALAVPGMYFLPADAPARAAALAPGARGELEITDLLAGYLAEARLEVRLAPAEALWFDAGTPEGLLAAAAAVRQQVR